MCILNRYTGTVLKVSNLIPTCLDSVGFTDLWQGLDMMFTACLPQQYQNPTRTNRSSGLIRNSYRLDKQMIIDNS
jgi:hypothetical protein